ncbi:MAG: FecR domain-containing protein [Bacteroidota bacterium]
MKIDENNPLHAEVLAKYLAGEMSEEESQAFGEEYAVSGENKERIEVMKRQWSSLEGYQGPKVPDTFKAWGKLHARLDEEKLIPAGATEPHIRFMPKLLRAAAILVLFLGVGAVIYLSNKPKGNVQMVRVNTGDETNTLIKTLADGSVIYIAQNSLFSFPDEFEATSRNVELKGEAFFDIAPNPAKPFIIETEEAFIQVVGTAFNVKTQNGKDFELVVDRGKVKVTLKKDPSHTEVVVAGEKIVRVKDLLVKSRQLDLQCSSWYKQRMHFKDESLRNIITVLNRNFDTKFVVAEKETGNRKLTVTFQNETAGTMTELICLTLNLKSQNINGSIVLSENMEGAKRN